MTYEVDRSGQAEMEKFSRSTFSERKIMSTKTSIKRIAAVAAVALTLGGFSAVTAHAAVGTTSAVGDMIVTAATANNTDNGSSSTSETATATAGANNYVGIIVKASATTPVQVLITGGTGVSGNTTVTGSGTASLTVSSSGAAADAAINIPTPTAGTITVKTYTISNGSQSSTASAALTITVKTAAVFSVGLSTSIISKGTTASATTDDTVSADKAVGTQVAVIKVTTNDQTATALNGVALSASVTGSGLVLANNAGTAASPGSYAYARSASIAASQMTTNSGVGYFDVATDGTAGVGTITISGTDPVSGVTSVIATETVTFTATAAAVTATQNLKVLKAGGTTYASTTTAGAALTVANTAPLSAFITDSNGNKVLAANIGSGYTVKAVSSDSSIITGGTCVAAIAGTGSEGSGWATTATAITTGEFNCPVSGTALAASGKSATITVTVYKADGTTIAASAAPVTFTIGGAVAKVAISTDASSYVSGAPVSFVTTVADSSGNAAYDQDVAVFSTAPTSSTVLGTSSLPGTGAIQFIGGKNTKTGSFAPVFGTSVTISAVDALAALNALTTSFTVSSPSQDAAQAAVDAANEATDAANAATDAANNAMDSADAAQQAALDAGDKADAALAAVTDLATKVSAIATQIAALSALVKKIAAKVKA
jgi:hypothetical protein